MSNVSKGRSTPPYALQSNISRDFERRLCACDSAAEPSQCDLCRTQGCCACQKRCTNAPRNNFERLQIEGHLLISKANRKLPFAAYLQSVCASLIDLIDGALQLRFVILRFYYRAA